MLVWTSDSLGNTVNANGELVLLMSAINSILPLRLYMALQGAAPPAVTQRPPGATAVTVLSLASAD